jgi:HEPN domain-containing protein
MASVAEKWADLARYDLDTALAMESSRRFLYVLFCCQQAVEKALKGIIASKREDFPPRIHNLVRLSEVAALELDETRLEFLRLLSSFYIQTRYPEEIADLASRVSETDARDTLRRTEELVQWLLSIQQSP